MASKTGFVSAIDPLIDARISALAVCCSNASRSSRVSWSMRSCRSGQTIVTWNFSNSTALRRDALMAPRFGRFGPDLLAWLHCSPDETPRNISYCSMVLGSWELSVSENPSAIPTTRMSSPLFPEGSQTESNV